MASTRPIALLVLLIVFVVSGSALGQSSSSDSSAGLANSSWILGNNPGRDAGGYAGYDLRENPHQFRMPNTLGSTQVGPRTSWLDASQTSDDSATVPENSGLLVLAVAASWLITCMVRSGRRSINYRNGVVVRTSEQPSFGERIELGLAGTRR